MQLTGQVPVVIPTFNAGPLLADVLEAIRAQQGPFRPHVIAIDSGSTDSTLDLLRRFSAQVLRVAPGGFNHGATRNEALSHAQGDCAVLLVQDAVPASDAWLSSLVNPLLEDSSIAGTYARQIPATHASRVTAHYLMQWVATGEHARVVGPLTPESLDGLSPLERHAACAFDNVCSCIRLSVWRQHPFVATPIAEDLEWAREVLYAGYKLAYVPDAIVRHSHERSIAYELQRTYLVHQRLHAMFGLATIPNISALLRAIASTVPANARIASREPTDRLRAIMRGVALGATQPLGQYLGAWSSRHGRQLLRVSGV